MVKRIQVFGIFFILVLSGGYSIDLKHIVSYMPDNPGIAVSYGRTQWVSDTEIFSSEVSETRIFDMTNRRSSMLFNPMKEVKTDIIFKNEEILLLRDLNIDRNNGQEYYIYALKTKRMYPLDKEGTEQYLADGGKKYEYYKLTIEEKERWDYYLSCYKITLPNMTNEMLWKEKAEIIFDTSPFLIDRFYPQDKYENMWLGGMDGDLYLLQVDESGVKTSCKVQNNIGTSGVFLMDGRILAAYCPPGENPFNREEEAYLKLAVFNSKGELEQTIDKEIYVAAGRSKMMSISPDGTKLLVMGYDKDHFNKWDVQINIYEIIYD